MVFCHFPYNTVPLHRLHHGPYLPGSQLLHLTLYNAVANHRSSCPFSCHNVLQHPPNLGSHLPGPQLLHQSHHGPLHPGQQLLHQKLTMLIISKYSRHAHLQSVPHYPGHLQVNLARQSSPSQPMNNHSMLNYLLHSHPHSLIYPPTTAAQYLMSWMTSLPPSLSTS
jgi:hypothetical protein